MVYAYIIAYIIAVAYRLSMRRQWLRLALESEPSCTSGG